MVGYTSSNRIDEVHVSSLLFTGYTRSAEGNAHRYRIKSDWVGAMFAFLEKMFCDLGIVIHFCVLNNKEHCKGKIQLYGYGISPTLVA